MYRIVTTALILVGMFIGETDALHAYDIHHPNPMSILNGTHHARKKVEPVKEHNATKGVQPWRMFKRRKEGKYVIKPEPYSITSKKSDPELLGPQRTLAVTPTATAPVPTAATPSVPTAPVTPGKSSGMTREECIGLIGQEKFDAYVQKYGGEKGALHRCLILKRTRG